MVDDAREQELCNAVVSAQRTKNGNEATNLVCLKQSGKISEGRYQDDACKAGVRFWEGRDVLHVRRQVR